MPKVSLEGCQREGLSAENQIQGTCSLVVCSSVYLMSEPLHDNGIISHVITAQTLLMDSLVWHLPSLQITLSSVIDFVVGLILLLVLLCFDYCVCLTKLK